MAVQNIPVYDLPFLYISGLQLSNNATTPDSKVDVAIGQCRDSTDSIDIVINEVTTIDADVVGFNGLDTGTLTTNAFYKVFAIADSANYNPSGFILTAQTNSVPVMPFGYDSYRLIGYVKTDGSSDFLVFYMAAGTSGNSRYIQWDAPIAVTVTDSGTSATYSAMNLAVGVPNANFAKVKLYAKWDPNAAGDILTFQASGGVGDWLPNTAISTTIQDLSFDILPLIAVGVPKVSYKISAGTLTNVAVMGYDFIV